ncbi:MAG: Type I Iterative PKS [Trichoglossum hirsutum]|nr:MAG: Type I Iterative PKS [Trichoglossum hirsutum]
MAFPSLVIFGPQTTWPSAEYLSQIRHVLLNEPCLSVFLDAVRDLPNLWPTLVEANPGLNRVPGGQLLNDIKRWVDKGDFSHVSESPPNVLSTPLTIIVHVVQYLHYVRNIGPGTSHAHILDSINTGGVQGFSTGFLTATALACSKEEKDVNIYGAVALRLAVCIGAFVDLDGIFAEPPNETSCLVVRWTKEFSVPQLLHILKNYPEAYISATADNASATITAPKSTATALMDHLSMHGLVVKLISLEGRFHCSVHESAVESINSLCESNRSLQFPTARSLLVPLRSNSDAQVVTEGSLHWIALKSILTERSNWHLTIAATTLQLNREGNAPIVVAGLVDCIPRSIMREPGQQIIKLSSFELSDGSPGPDSMVSTPKTEISRAPSPLDRSYPDHAIAIVGMACRFPGADSINDYWDIICSGTSMLGELPKERFSMQGPRLTSNANTPFWGNFLREVDAFDHRFFKKSSREAASMDPQQRLLLEVAYQAMESSGYFSEPSDVFLDSIGCYIGVSATDYEYNVASHPPTAYSALGTLRAFISGRVSHYFGWSGPSITYDTACSSSAVAIHSACKAIQAGECSTALAGGVSAITSPALYQNLAAAHFLSPSGASKAFDAKADGYCRGEGAGLVVLKKLSCAISDGNEILGVITGSAVNQSKNSTPITVPHSPSQSKLYRSALLLAGIVPEDVSFVEAHGTGTPVGDPIECESIRQVFGGPQRARKLNLGSVKGNIGHTGAASGAAALIKAVLMLQHETIPMQANFTTLNPKIAPLEPDQMTIPMTTQKWDADFRVACINNYGAAGSNAAIIVCQPPSDGSITRGHFAGQGIASPPRYPIFISADSAESLRAHCVALGKFLARQPSSQENLLACVAFNMAQKQNRSFPHILTITAATLADLRDQIAEGASGTSKYQLQITTPAKPVVLVFGGQINKTIGLDKDVYDACLIFRSHLDHCDNILRSIGLKGLFPDIFQKEPIEDVVSLHCTLFSLQYSCAKSWLDSGLRVDTVIGHSLGQLTAMCVSGSLSLEDSLKLVSGRASLIQRCWGPEKGAMVSVQSDIGSVLRLISLTEESGSGHKVNIACYNGPTSYVLAGSESSINAAEEIAANWASPFGHMPMKRLNVTHGFHSELVKSILPGLTELAGLLAFGRPTIPLETCSEGQSWNHIEPWLVAEQSLKPVYFAEAVERVASRLGPCTWIEAGSGSSVISMARRVLETSTPSSHSFQPIHLNSSDAMGSLVNATVNLWKIGLKMQFWSFNRLQRHQYSQVNLPPYQFEKSRHWLEYKNNVEALTPVAPTDVEHKPILLSFTKFQDWSQCVAEFSVDPRSEQYKVCVQGHAVLGNGLCPASLYIELVAKAATTLKPDSASTCLPCIEELEIHAPLGLGPDRAISLTLRKVEGATATWTFTFSSHARGASPKKAQHATGIISLQTLDNPGTTADFMRYQRLIGHSRCEALLADAGAEAIRGSLIYKMFAKVVQYADYYRGVRSISSKYREIAGHVMMSQPTMNAVDDPVCNPLVIDNFIQVAGLHVNCLNDHSDDVVFICTKIQRLQLGQGFRQDNLETRSWMVYSNFEHTSDKLLVDDIFVFDSASKRLVVTILGAQFTKVPISSLAKALFRASSAQETVASVTNGAAIANTRMMPTLQVKSDTIIDGFENNAASAFEHCGAMASKGSGRDDVLLAVRNLIREISDVPMDIIRDTSTLEELGIDSLMMTEVIGEIKRTFEVDIPVEDFQDLLDIKSLCQYLRSSRHDTNDIDTISGNFGSGVDLSSANVPDSQGMATPVSDVTAPQSDLVSNLAKLISERLDIMDTICRDTNVGAIGVDSLLSIELQADIEKYFGAKIDLERLNGDLTFGELNDMVLSRSEVTIPTRDKISPSHFIPRLAEISTSSGLLDAKTAASWAHAPECFARIRHDYDRFAKETKFAEFRAKVYPKQARLVLAYVVEAFATLGCLLVSLRPGERLPPIPHISKHDKVMSQFYRILEDAALITASDTSMKRTNAPIDRTPASTLYQEALYDFPQHGPEHKLLNMTGSKLAECLSGSVDPLQLLFRSKANKDLLEDVYTNAPMFAAGTKLLGSFLTKVFANHNGREKIRILELGAGTGGTTRYIVDQLVRQGIQFTYTFTDISLSMVAAARKKFSGYDCMEFMIVDVEKTPPDHLLDSYDIAISTNCIHATRSLVSSLTNIRKMLRSDGFLCLVELTRNLFWFDLVFGMLEGWWMFQDGRKHVLADESLWERSLMDAGFRHVDWSDGDTQESDQLRVITAFTFEPGNTSLKQRTSGKPEIQMETVVFKQIGSTSLYADIYYPPKSEPARFKRPVALMIHGGGHVMLSRKDIRPKQTQLLLDNGLLPVSIDYRLCPELNLIEGPMADVCSAFQWARRTLPTLQLQRPDVQADGDNVVAIGWSTGGHLAMTIAWTALQQNLKPPEAILAFYCPTNYEADFWKRPNFPNGSTSLALQDYVLRDAVKDKPITGYNVPAARRAVDGWMSPSDPRSRIVLHMNWKGQTLPILLGGLSNESNITSSSSSSQLLAQPSTDEIVPISPFAQIVRGNYRTPTYLVHGMEDDLIPWQQTQQVFNALVSIGVPTGVTIVKDAVHLFDLYSDPDGKGWRAVQEGYEFLFSRLALVTTPEEQLGGG